MNKFSGENEKDHGLIISWLESSISFLVKLSLGKRLEGIHPNRLDVYILSWLTLEIAVLIILTFTNLSALTLIILSVLFSYHLFEIAVTSFNSVIIMPIQKKRHRSMPRVFSLVLVDYLEVILIFGIIFHFLLEHDSILKSLKYSVSLATLAGINIDQESNVIFLAVIFEMLFGIFFLTGIIATIANYIGSKE
jgi:hypothetical protein